jgi:dihydroneopterin aldolase
MDIADITQASDATRTDLATVLAGRFQILFSADGPSIDYVMGGRVPGKSVVAVTAGTAEYVRALKDAKSWGARSAMLIAPAGQRLFAATGPDGIAAFVSLCHELGLEAWIGGSLEPPDIPRLLEHEPDVICIDSPASDEICALFPRSQEAGLAQAGYGEGDHVLVRDFILPVQIGAYGFEKERPQRVCFNVDAEVRRRSENPEDMRDVFSYDIILDGIRALVSGGHIVLVETLAERTAQKLLRHPDVLSVRVRVEKLDLGPAAVGVEIFRKRPSVGKSRSGLTVKGVKRA